MAIKEVRFDIYCSKCKHSDKTESEDPCWDCLNQGWNIDSHKPEFFEEKEKEEKKTTTTTPSEPEPTTEPATEPATEPNT